MSHFRNCNISTLISHSNGLDLIVKNCLFFNSHGSIFSSATASTLLSQNIFYNSHSTNTIYLKSSSNLSFLMNCFVSCDGTGSEVIKDPYGDVAFLSSARSLISSSNLYFCSTSTQYMEYIVGNELEHYSSNYSYNEGFHCAGSLMEGELELKSSMIYSYQCLSNLQIELFNSPNILMASKLTFIKCTKVTEISYAIQAYRITSNSDISDCYIINENKPFDCGVFYSSVTFKIFYLSKDTFSCYFGEAGSASSSGCTFNVNEDDVNADSLPIKCLLPIEYRCSHESNQIRTMIGILSLICFAEITPVLKI